MSLKDDSFELYDLRVEVICPPGERILCGAQPGDHFTMRGEMISLPPGQGFSVYSLGSFFHHRRLETLLMVVILNSGCNTSISS